jgi:hypothetical protein
VHAISEAEAVGAIVAVTIQFKHSRWMEARSHGPQQVGHCRVIDVFEGMRPWRRTQPSVLDAAAPMREEDGLDAALSRVRSDLPGVVVMDAVLGVSPAPLRLRVTVPELGPDQPLQVLADRHGRSIVVTRDPRRQGGIERTLAWMQSCTRRSCLRDTGSETAGR